jgi:type I restriction enzyme M protein
MFGAIIGDMVGSIYEFHNHRSKEFPLFNSKCFPTDDSIMTIAVAKAILENDGKSDGLENKTVEWMQKIGRQYPNCGYGGHFYEWMFARNPHPYNSFGNGAAMRVSACGWAGKTLEEVKALSHAVTVVTHNHPEGVKGAEATACAIFLARTGHSKEEIRSFIEENYYTLDFTIDEIRPTYEFNETCQGTVPQAIEAFLESTSFEDAIRIAISVGGDSDTLAAITGSIAEAFYGIPEELKRQAINQFRFVCRMHYLYATTKNDTDLLSIVEAFEKRYGAKLPKQ